ncbi:hypothetical protein BKA67DRAFT_652915 [Truncatella angustata]|uniref:HTH APSES-type domain-containing protein n=1 Tax=Truncatella angustata TaxID=152316 RepID=A0A9P8UX94_9PEZI|nr:uncharacterized protein BKA67DRAFT_652915 [Truncatella angustata]KAH6659691.1 hypothetical protein BKA67DRAFT_652915 [Truncatella angustata]
MISVASLLNPAPSGPSVHGFPPSPAPSASPTSSLADESSFYDRSMIPKNKMPKDAAIFTKGKAKGVVNFHPFEILDEFSIGELRKYQVFPVGKIQEYCRHIPYNSGKKNFFEKTGRESFEVFQYVFKVPGDDIEYAVMWDYNVGLVRMTPFFKCCKYSKTTPAKMLNLNPGLKEITHSITGGSIMAQGYWMPYECAKAVCATFCHHIAGALIPIFGPDFPSQCISLQDPKYRQMSISPSIIIQSTREAEHFRRFYTNMVTSTSSASPQHDRKFFKDLFVDSRHNHRYRMRRPFISCNNPCGTDTDGERSPAADCSISDRLHYASIPSIVPNRITNGWTPANMSAQHYDASAPNTWLSAVPQFVGNQSYHMDHGHQAHSRAQSYGNPPPQNYNPHHHHDHHGHRSHHPNAYTPTSHRHSRQPKRPADHIETDYGRDGGGSSRYATGPSTAATSPFGKKTQESSSGPEQNAAFLLMNLSVRDTKSGSTRQAGGIASETTSPVDATFPRVKRSRANSM